MDKKNITFHPEEKGGKSLNIDRNGISEIQNQIKMKKMCFYMNLLYSCEYYCACRHMPYKQQEALRVKFCGFSQQHESQAIQWPAIKLNFICFF